VKSSTSSVGFARVTEVDAEESRLVEVDSTERAPSHRGLYAGGRPINTRTCEPLDLWTVQNRFASRPGRSKRLRPGAR
jgi:hypothetical protein